MPKSALFSQLGNETGHEVRGHDGEAAPLGSCPPWGEPSEGAPCPLLQPQPRERRPLSCCHLDDGLETEAECPAAGSVSSCVATEAAGAGAVGTPDERPLRQRASTQEQPQDHCVLKGEAPHPPPGPNHLLPILSTWEHS